MADFSRAIYEQSVGRYIWNKKNLWKPEFFPIFWKNKKKINTLFIFLSGVFKTDRSIRHAKDQWSLAWACMLTTEGMWPEGGVLVEGEAGQGPGVILLGEWEVVEGAPVGIGQGM